MCIVCFEQTKFLKLSFSKKTNDGQTTRIVLRNDKIFDFSNERKETNKNEQYKSLE